MGNAAWRTADALPPPPAPTPERVEAHHLGVVVRERDDARRGLKQIATRLGLHHRATVEQIITEINHMEDRVAELRELKQQVAAGETRTLARVVRRG